MLCAPTLPWDLLLPPLNVDAQKVGRNRRLPTDAARALLRDQRQAAGAVDAERKVPAGDRRVGAWLLMADDAKSGVLLLLGGRRRNGRRTVREDLRLVPIRADVLDRVEADGIVLPASLAATAPAATTTTALAWWRRRLRGRSGGHIGPRARDAGGQRRRLSLRTTDNTHFTVKQYGFTLNPHPRTGWVAPLPPLPPPRVLRVLALRVLQTLRPAGAVRQLGRCSAEVSCLVVCVQVAGAEEV